MAKKSFVQVGTELFEKAPDNSIIINGEKHYCIAGRWLPLSDPCLAPMVMPDIQPYRSTLTGEEITSRSRHREHLRAHGCVEVGNERLSPPKTRFTAADGLRQELIARLNG